MKIAALLLLLLAPALAGAQANIPYQSPATVAKRLKAQCAALPPQQRPECESKARAEVRASIDRHHQLKGEGKGAAKPVAQPGAKPPAKPPAKAPVMLVK